MARLSASVPPAVNTSSAGSASIKAATDERAASSSALACCPKVWMDEGLPNVSAIRRVTAAATSGRTGAVALKSR